MRAAILVATFVLMPSLTALAGESVDAAGRTITYRTDVAVVERDADDKPVKGTAERVGVTLHEKGPSAGAYSQVQIEIIWQRTSEGGVYSGEFHRTYASGDEQDLTFEGRFGKGWSKGTYECTGGTGRYADAACSGTYEGQSFPNGMAANRWSGTIEFAD